MNSVFSGLTGTLPPEPLRSGLLPTDPRSLCPLPSTEFVEPHRNKIPGYATDSEEMFSTLVADTAGGKEAEGV